MTRSGFVALIGEPNAGKSTLLNKMVGAKISIVTHKVQTTRTRIRGVSIEDQSQIIFSTPSVSPRWASTNKSVMSESAAPLQAAATIARSNRLRGLNNPGVSTKII